MAETPRAAVALIEAAAPEPSVLLIRRAERPGDPWSGQWALPGGRIEPDDGDPLAACVRETREEVGLALDRAACVAGLACDHAGRTSRRPVLVAPFRFVLAARPALTPDPREVAGVRWLPLTAWRVRGAHGRATIMGLDDEPFIDVDGAPLWGFTYRLLAREYPPA